jgi:hypothetical protein
MKAVIAGTVSSSPRWQRRAPQNCAASSWRKPHLETQPVQIPARTGERACSQRSHEPLSGANSCLRHLLSLQQSPQSFAGPV